MISTYGFPPMRPGGSGGRLGSRAAAAAAAAAADVGRGGLNPLKTPGGGSPSGPNGYPAIMNFS